MTAPATQAVLDALEAAGGADCARFVGGCVRNALIGRPIADIDVATTLKDQTASLAGERVSAELLKLFAADDPRAAVRLMRQTGVLAVVLPQALDIERFEALVELERALGEPDPLLRLAALLPDDPDA